MRLLSHGLLILVLFIRVVLLAAILVKIGLGHATGQYLKSWWLLVGDDLEYRRDWFGRSW